MAALVAEHARARGAAAEAFVRSNRVQPLWRALTHATDQLLSQSMAGAHFTLVAVGGYGRRELFPHSDVDVLLLVPPQAAEKDTKHIVSLLQRFWDMQVAVSHATRTLEEAVAAAKADSTIAASVMDARFVAGDRKLFLALKKRLRQEVWGSNPGGFIAAKLAERDQRHAKWGDSRFMLEPNVKEGKGGLRDLHTLTWLARYCYPVSQATELVREDMLTPQEWRHYRQAYLFFATVRTHLHLLRGRGDDRLTFDMQTRIAERLKFRGRTPQQKAERLMLRYFQFARYVGTITRIFCAMLEEENLRAPTAPFTQENVARSLPDGFVLDAGRLNFAPEIDLSLQPVCVVALFYVAQKNNLDLHPRAQLAISRQLPVLARKLPFEGEANRLFMEILLAPKSPADTLRRMSEMGVLGALVPEFGRITGMMQYDGYHTYTVDEHTLVAVDNLFTLESGALFEQMPIASAVAKDVGDRAPLYLAMLCHDIAKGLGGAHAIKGESIVERMAQRFGLDAAQGQLAAWLVKHHLNLSETAFKRDLDDPQTISDFVALVQSPERLRLLLIVTVADIKAVGPAIWNGWKGSLMRDLYHRAMLQMGVGGGDLPAQDFLRAEVLADTPKALRDAALGLMDQRPPASWWYRPRAEQIATIRAYAGWLKNRERPALSVVHDNFRAVTEVTCCLAYQPQWFRLLAGVMAWVGASIVSARVMVLADGAAMATLGIQDIEGKSFASEEQRLAELPRLMEKALAGALDFAVELPKRRAISRGREVTIAPSVFVDNQVSAQATVIEINARDRLGLLHDMLGAMEACQLQVITAHIATYGQKAVDVFYVKDAYGMKLLHPTKLAAVQQALLAASEGQA